MSAVVDAALPLDAVLRADVEVLDLRQGTPQWHAFRRTRYGASDAAAMLGLSAHETRSALLRRIHTGLQREFSDYVQEHVLENGHAVEAAARPLAEERVGDDLSPVTCARRGTKIAASCDGLTLMRDTAWECKQWNEGLAEQVRAGVVPDTHMPQCQQELLVTGAQRLLFTVTDGSPECFVCAEVLPDLAWFERIVRGWAQFEADLEAYVPEERVPAAVAQAVEHLPAVSVRMDGALAVRSNLPEFGERLRAFVAQIPKAPSTDQEFADTEAACKALKRAEEALDAAEGGALASIATVEEMRRTVGTLREVARQSRLAAEKIVAARKDQLREAAVRHGCDQVAEHIDMLRGLHGGYLTFSRASAASEIGASIKGLKTLDSIRAAVDARVATLKIAATAATDRIAANLKTLAAAGEQAQALFHDRPTLVQKDPDAVIAIVAQRLAEDEKRRAALAATPAPTAAPTAAPTPAPTPAPAPQVVAADRGDVRLADINERLGWSLTSAQVEALGVRTHREPGRVTVLLRRDDLPLLGSIMVTRIEKALQLPRACA